MTVIAWDGTTLAADTVTSSGMRVSKLVRFRLDGEEYGAAAAGTSRACAQMIAWAESGGDPATFPALASDDVDDSSMVVVRLRDGRTLRHDGIACGYEIISPKWAFGSGGDVAMGALAMGADAVRAAEIACELNAHCALPVESVSAGADVRLHAAA